MISAGITGGIGSGKSTICRELEKLGAVVIYADDLAKQMMTEDDALRSKLAAAFGTETYNADGSLNKPHLIEEAFSKNRVVELNAIVHPALRNKTEELILKHEREGAPVFIIEAAVLLNRGRPDHLDKIVLVLSNRDEQVKRVKMRDGTAENEIIARMEKQPDFESMTGIADYVIHNDGSLDDLKKRAADLYQTLLSESSEQ